MKTNNNEPPKPKDQLRKTRWHRLRARLGRGLPLKTLTNGRCDHRRFEHLMNGRDRPPGAATLMLQLIDPPRRLAPDPTSRTVLIRRDNGQSMETVTNRQALPEAQSFQRRPYQGRG